MKRFLWPLFLWIISFKLFASAPMEGFSPVDKGPLLVKWESNLKPLFIGFKGKSPPPLTKSPLSLRRFKSPLEKLELIFISQDKSYAPLILPIPDGMDKVLITKKQLKKVKENELWLWGMTPQSHCGGVSQLHLRFLNKEKRSLYTNLGGLFAWKITKDLPKKPLLYLTSQLNLNTPKSSTSSAFELVSNEKDQFQCKLYYGKKCPFLFRLKEESFGKNHRINFQGSKKPLNIICPI